MHWQNVQLMPLPRMHDDWVTRARYDHDLGSLVTCSLDGTIHICDMEKVQHARDDAAACVRRTFRGHTRGVNAFAYSPQFKFMASCGLERKVLLWDPFTRRAITSLDEHMASMKDVIINDNLNLIISQSVDKVVKLWDVRTMRCLQTIVDDVQHRPENKITAIMFDRQNHRLVTAAKKMYAYSVVKQLSVGPRSHTDALCGALYNRNFSQIVSGDIDGTINVWDVDTGACVFKFDAGMKVTTMCFDQSKRRLLTGGHGGEQRMFNFSNGATLLTMRRHKIHVTDEMELHAAELAANDDDDDDAANAYKEDDDEIFAGNRANAQSNEVTGVAFLTEDRLNQDRSDRYAVYVGWDKKAIVYKESNSEEEVEPHYVLDRHHTTDIQCVCVCKTPQLKTMQAAKVTRTAHLRAGVDEREYTDDDGDGMQDHLHLIDGDGDGDLSEHYSDDENDVIVMAGGFHGGHYNESSFLQQKATFIATGDYEGKIVTYNFHSGKMVAVLMPPTPQPDGGDDDDDDDDDDDASGGDDDVAADAGGNAGGNNKLDFNGGARSIEKLVNNEAKNVLLSTGSDGYLQLWCVTRSILLAEQRLDHQVGSITHSFLFCHFLPCLCYQTLTLYSSLRSLPHLARLVSQCWRCTSKTTAASRSPATPADG
jgi:WD40 repeat protein